MKIWITRDSAGSVMTGGLERVRVWFTKPVWRESKIFLDLPFSGVDAGFLEESDWEVITPGKHQRSPVSFGSVFGYSDQKDEELSNISKFVWGKVTEHFLNAEFAQWDELEKKGKVNRRDFFLELDLSIKLNQSL